MRFRPSNLHFYEYTDTSKQLELTIEGMTARHLLAKTTVWTLLVAVFTTESTLLYQDGVQVLSDTTNKLPSAGFEIEDGEYAAIFTDPGGTNTNSHQFQGDLKDLRFYNTAFTPYEVNELYTGQAGCVRCGNGLTTLAVGAESVDQCVCQVGSFDSAIPPAILTLDDRTMTSSDTTAYDHCGIVHASACQLVQDVLFPFSTTGVSIVLKMRFTSSAINYERVFAFSQKVFPQTGATGDHYTSFDFALFRLGTSNTLMFNTNTPEDTSCQFKPHPYEFATNEDLTLWIRYDPASTTIKMSINGVEDVKSACTFPSMTIKQHVFGGSETFATYSNVKLAGFAAFGQYLSDAQTAAVADTLVFNEADTVATCMSCQAGLTTLAPGADSVDQCVCERGSFSQPAKISYNPSGGSHAFPGTALSKHPGQSSGNEVEGTDYIDLGPLDWNIASNGGFTAMGKFKTHSSSNYYMRVFELFDDFLSSQTVGIGVLQVGTGTGWRQSIYVNGQFSCVSETVTVSDNTVSTFIMRYDAASSTLYPTFNGVDMSSVTCSIPLDNYASLLWNMIAAPAWDNQYLHGEIYGVIAYDYFLTKEDAQEKLNGIKTDTVNVVNTESCQACVAGLTTLTANASSSGDCVCQKGSHQVGDLVSFFPLDGTLVDDLSSATMASSTTAYHTDATHGPVLNANGNVYTITSQALATVLDASAFTVSFWIYFVSLPSNDHSNILTRWDNYDAPYSATGGFLIMTSTNQKLQFTASSQSYYSATTLQVSRWYHVSVVKTSSSSTDLYLDGVLDVRWTAATRAMLNPINDIGIGSYCHSSSASSTAATCSTETNNAMFYLMDLRFYSRGLSAAEAATLATRADHQGETCNNCPAATPYTSPDQGATSATECEATPSGCGVVSPTTYIQKIVEAVHIEHGTISGSQDQYTVFKHNPTDTDTGTEYRVEFLSDHECDILLVGGGGGGSQSHGGGGGGGAVVFFKGVVMNGVYTITVGDGGGAASSGNTAHTGKHGLGIKGIDSEIYKNSTNKVIAEGGGGGGYNAPTTGNGGDGGSGGGGDAYDSAGSGGAANAYSAELDGGTGTKFGHDGADSNVVGGAGAGGGGGGAGGAGSKATGHQNGGNDGGIGISEANGYDFKSLFDITDNTIGEHYNSKVYFGGGGGGGCWTAGPCSDGGHGGGGAGGAGGTSPGNPGTPGTINTGGGGGGGGDYWPTGGRGGSGIVIIRYKALSHTGIGGVNFNSNVPIKGDVTSGMVKYASFHTSSSPYTLTFSAATTADVLVISGSH
jgi:hypothetical protein